MVKMNLHLKNNTPKYDWGYRETDKRVLHLNMLHEVKTCGVCNEFTLPMSKCIRRNLIVESNTQQCESGDFCVRM